MEIQQQIHGIIQKVLATKNDTRSFADDELLLTNGRLQSIDVLDLILELETAYGLDFSDHPFDKNEFDSVNNILELINTLRQ